MILSIYLEMFQLVGMSILCVYVTADTGYSEEIGVDYEIISNGQKRTSNVFLVKCVHSIKKTKGQSHEW